MPVFQHPLWGYTLTYPDAWIHTTVEGAEAFAASREALVDQYEGPHPGHVLVKAEWNSTLQAVEPLWSRHIGMLASMMGAKQVGSAAWELAGAAGFESEIAFPKRDTKRLWTGILARDFLVLKFMVLHPRQVRAEFEPLATRLIASLRFPTHLPDTHVGEAGLPLPPGAEPAAPQSILNDIEKPEEWRAFSAQSSVGALQAFYLRECPALGWEILEFVPFPYPSDLGFARFKLHKGDQTVTLGIFPFGNESSAVDNLGKVVFRLR